jgi:hypothetical protein
MEERQIKVTYNKSGRGSLTPKITLPMSWIKQMSLSEDDREVIISFDGKEIKIRKAENKE